MTSALETRIEREDNVTTITKPEGKYTVIYGVHSAPQDTAQLPEKFDGLFFEMSYGCLDSVYYDFDFSLGTQYKQVVRFLQERNIPAYFADTRNANCGKDFGCFDEYFSEVMDRNPDISKMNDKLMYATSLTKENFKLVMFFRKFTRNLVKQHNYPLYYGLFPMFELALAHKQNYLMRQTGASHFVTILGLAHTGIESAIMTSSEEKLAALRRRKRYLKRYAQPEHFYKIERFDFGQNGWYHRKTYTVPELQKIIESL